MLEEVELLELNGEFTDSVEIIKFTISEVIEPQQEMIFDDCQVPLESYYRERFWSSGVKSRQQVPTNTHAADPPSSGASYLQLLYFLGQSARASETTNPEETGDLPPRYTRTILGKPWRNGTRLNHAARSLETRL